MLFMLTKRGVKLHEKMDSRMKVKNPEKSPQARKDPMEEKKEKETWIIEYYETFPNKNHDFLTKWNSLIYISLSMQDLNFGIKHIEK
ncbi:hypothetical protein YC2023_122391 [Brassica napus]